MQPALKTRLLGAAVLIALAVIVVPLFFSGEPSGDGSQNISLDIPQPPDQKLQTRTLSVAPPSESGSSAVATTHSTGSQGLATVNVRSKVPPEVDTGMPSTPPDAVESAAHGEDTQADAAPESSAAPTKTAVAKSDADATEHPGRAANARYQISLGAYTKKDNAEDLVAKVGQLGYEASVSSVSIGGIPASRVDVGPFDSRARAEAARLKLHAQLPRAPAKLVSAPTDQHDNAPAKALPADQAGGWAVQVVAYSKQADATQLRDRLRKAGFDSYVDKVQSSGRSLWRVRVGPLAQRDDAVSTLARIKSHFSRLNGVVVTLP
ncbi:MAG TPA: SPOR domain-containing protein [Oleiagrimonas sp.]|nr:SPOR domain-containing protein [Oleiagrimonas sp.]